MKRAEALSAAALIVACLFWGSGFVFAKVSLAELPVSQVVLWRFAVASVVLLPFALRRGARIDLADLPRFAICGFFAVPAAYLVQFEGIRRSNSSTAALLVGLLPVILVVGSMIFLRERPAARTWSAIAVSVAGVALISGGGAVRSGWSGPLLILLSLGFVAAWTLISKDLMRERSSFAVTAWSIIIGTLLTLPIAIALDGAPRIPSRGVAAALVASGILCTALAHVCWNWGLQLSTVSRAGIYGNLETVVGVLLGWMILGEPLDSRMIAGGLLILIAAALVLSEENAATESG